ncbi:uncharacterized protein A1O5_09536 [Cladophialophora psammophila CBS 110553]|uniref:Xylanolytic transcriptional activator regulatory domain-containing protein n=1 Tax=Cladophialophora psammophila CBS 110553 TaxID=1182543 RepID=W9WHY9_9EURO|nr:uncharacterized protein A1O5_09536 [Cladophialophora psammophila CBS 110553]EXJ67523.1 hypothetical protein A1O5_09536 [Cladophialophora psammophila CBS 110553]
MDLSNLISFQNTYPTEIPAGKECMNSLEQAPDGGEFASCSWPTTSQQDASGVDIPWPIEWQTAAKASVLPEFEPDLVQPFFWAILSSAKPLSNAARASFRQLIDLATQKSLWRSTNVGNFSSRDVLSSCLHLYFNHFHEMLPIVHRPTFDPDDSLITTLAMAGIGASYVTSPNAQLFSKTILELNRQILTLKVRKLKLTL